MTGDLAGRVTIVTGGASGIGRAVASLFALEGASVAILDRDAPGAQHVANALCESELAARSFPADVSDAASCARAVSGVQDALGPPAILVNCAGIIARKTVLETREEEWDRIMAVNVKSIFLMARAVLPAMIDAGGGSIVNVASGWGLVGGPRAAAYCASKGAVVQLSRAMAVDHGPEGVRVNCVCPGDTETPMLRQEAAELGENQQRFLEDAARRPLPRVGRPDDVAQACLYLAGDRSAWVTGTCLVVDGGGLAG